METMEKQSTTYRRPKTDEARQRQNEYLRQYRREHPERVQQWRRNYILKAAARLAGAASNDGQQIGGGNE